VIGKAVAASVAGVVGVALMLSMCSRATPPVPAILAGAQQVSVNCAGTIPKAVAPKGKLDAAAVAKMAVAVGWRGDDVRIAVAVARAESAWNPTATLLNTNGSIDHGLYQINSVHAAILAGGNWRDPMDNTKMAYKVWTDAGRRWRPWVTYNSGSYLKFMQPLPNIPAATAPASDCQPAGPISCKGKTFDKKAFGKYENGLIPASALCVLEVDKRHRLRADAAQSFDNLARAYRARFKSSICITDSYRSLDAQRDLYHRKPDLAAIPGTSNHGLGMATDLCGGLQNAGSEQDEWMHEKAPDYGWAHPAWAEPSGSRPEAWHWECKACGAK
jgi:hypothetical protein